ncbi:ABC transporter ATP-binding protein [Bartonella ancashensis]|uniref:Methionine ABC transporter ATP-binding protein n=1 Tax=Bartonella ancashensis TaxID=1318743 RepID=A0A0M3T2S1_9HYPH|nr:ATP-binding cassette domain-containing protein [Bartonella ancashensis]ALE03225.1 Methionine ABC transporter ATP-binding protein [Bartonella ancashensis]
MIELSRIGVVFKPKTSQERRALTNINLKIDQGSFVTIIGSNGAGKSTFLGVLSGEILPTEGQIIINGHNIAHQPIRERAGKVACVFQDSLVGSCGALTIKENLALAALRGSRRRFRSALRREKKQFFRDKIAQLGLNLEEHLHNRMDSLSGGQRQAVCLIMATLARADILLLDEHTSALDPGMADFVMNLTKKVVEEKQLTTIMVTHSIRQALDYGDRMLMLHGGEVVLDLCKEERKDLKMSDVMNMFQKAREVVLDDDRLLMD